MSAVLEVLPPEPPSALAVVESNPQHLMRRATDVAGVCREIVLKTACNIQGKKYVKCEGWMSIATAHGCIASSRDVQRVDGGWTAIGEIRRIHDGVVLATAEGFVGKDEKRWGSSNEYACRAMAQTRAISRACRAAFAHVVVMMDAGLSTTPFEEVPDGGFEQERTSAARPVEQEKKDATPTTRAWFLEYLLDTLRLEDRAVKDYAVKFNILTPDMELTQWPLEKVPTTVSDRERIGKVIQSFVNGVPQEAPPQGETVSGWRSVEVPFGKSKGLKLGELKDEDLSWWCKNFKVEETFISKTTQKPIKKKAETLAADRAFRAALDEAAKEKGGDQ